MNPFKYGKEVSGYQFYDRKKHCAELRQVLLDGSSNVVLFAPRRYGKTSMVLRVLQQLKSEGIKCLHFDISKVSTIDRFCIEYASAAYALWGGVPELVNKVKEYLAHLHPSISFSDSMMPQISFDYGKRMNSIALSEVIDLPEKLATASGNEPIVVAFDEFQDVANISKDIPLESIFRSVIQSHNNVRYVFLGSKTHLITRMFGSKSRPFYKSALSMKIGKPPVEDSEEFLTSHFEKEGIELPVSVGKRIIEVSENIPYFLQAMASLSFQSVVARRGKRVTNEDLNNAIERFAEGNEDYYEEIIRNLPENQRLLIEALSRNPIGIFNEEYRNKHHLGGISTVHSSITGLLNKGIIDSIKGAYYVADPFFARYVKTTSATSATIE